MSSPRVRKVAVGLTAALTVSVAAVAFWEYQDEPSRFVEVTPGVLCRSELLSSGELEEVLDEHDIRTVVNLVPSSRANARRLEQEARTCRENGVRFVDLPLKADTPPTPEQVSRWLAVLDDETSRPILVHCKHGVVRTGMMVAIYQMEYLHRENARVLAELPGFGHDLGSPERRRVREFVLGYQPRWKRAAAAPAPGPDRGRP